MNQINFGIEDAKRVITEMRLCYGKKFSDQWAGVDPMDLANKMVQMFHDLTPVDLAKGFAKMQTQAWPPTLPEFKAWCLGSSLTIGNQNPIHATYRNKSAALANIEAWLSDSTTRITNAEREAYNRCYTMFSNLQFNYSDKQKFHTYEAFKGFYDEVVKEFVQQGVEQSIWVEPPKIESKRKTVASQSAETPEQKQRNEEMKKKIEALMAQGKTIGQATMEVMKGVGK